jgi:hypothetical protein
MYSDIVSRTSGGELGYIFAHEIEVCHLSSHRARSRPHSRGGPADGNPITSSPRRQPPRPPPDVCRRHEVHLPRPALQHRQGSLVLPGHRQSRRALPPRRSLGATIGKGVQGLEAPTLSRRQSRSHPPCGSLHRGVPPRASIRKRPSTTSPRAPAWASRPCVTTSRNWRNRRSWKESARSSVIAALFTVSRTNKTKGRGAKANAPFPPQLTD